jgi:hypothetical protein
LSAIHRGVQSCRWRWPARMCGPCVQEARIAFLEEEVPGLVAKGASLGEDVRSQEKNDRPSSSCQQVCD